MNPSKNIPLVLFTFLSISHIQCHGAIAALVDTGGGVGNTTFDHGGSWTGNGTVSDIDSSTSAGTYKLVDNFSGTGVLALTDLESDGGSSAFLHDPAISQTSTVTLGGSGAADFYVSTAAAEGSFARVYRQEVRLLDANTSSIVFNVSFSTPLHLRDTNTITGDYSGYYPWLLSASKAGGGNVNYQMDITNISTFKDDYISPPSTGIDGVIDSSVIFNGLGTLSEVGEDLRLIANNVGNRTEGTNANFIGVKGVYLTDILPDPILLDNGGNPGDDLTLHPDELSNGILTNAEQLVATTATVTITPTAGGNFASGTQFYFTSDGYQGEDLFNAVPEPSALIFSLVGMTPLLFSRRRKG